MKLTRKLSVGLHAPSFSADELPSPAAYIEFSRHSEAMNFDTMWTEDRILHPVPMLDSMLLLGWAAAHTTHMTLGTAVMAVNLRRAAVEGFVIGITDPFDTPGNPIYRRLRHTVASP
jgi:hypothetical protein